MLVYILIPVDDSKLNKGVFGDPSFIGDMCFVDKHSRPDHDADLCGAAINDFDGSRKDIPIAAYYWDDYNYCILILWCPGIEWNLRTDLLL